MTCTCLTNPPGIFLCASCCDGFEELLGRCDVVDGQLSEAVRDVSMTARYGSMGGSGGGSLHGPAPLNVTALSARQELHQQLMSTAILIAQATRDRLTGRGVHAISNYVFAHMNWLRADSHGPVAYREIRERVAAAKQILEPGGERVNVGRCGYVLDGHECTQPLNPYRDQDTIRCGTCGTTWDVKDRQRDAIGGAWGAVATPSLIVRALKEYGLRITPKDITNWTLRGDLVAVGMDGARKTYRVSEVWAVAKNKKRKVA